MADSKHSFGEILEKGFLKFLKMCFFRLMHPKIVHIFPIRGEGGGFKNFSNWCLLILLSRPKFQGKIKFFHIFLFFGGILPFPLAPPLARKIVRNTLGTYRSIKYNISKKPVDFPLN